MKCFECGSKCLTNYLINQTDGRITHVYKECQKCGWESFHTKVPESIQETQRPAKRLEPQNIKVFPLSANFNGGAYGLRTPEVMPPTSINVIHEGKFKAGSPNAASKFAIVVAS